MGENSRLPLFRGHPKGLVVLTLAEGWQAAGVYSVQSLLILYMSGWLFTPAHSGAVIGYRGWAGLFGPISGQALSAQTMGLYLGLFFLTPLLGGWLGDRFLGPRRAAIIGAVVATIGLVLLIWPAPFLIALLVSAMGAGMLRCNLTAQTGHLYPRDDSRRDAGFALLFAGLNTGAFLGPLLIGALGERGAWRWGFIAAAVAMGVALVLLIAGDRTMPPDVPPEARRSARLRPGDGRVLIGLVLVMLVTAAFWVAQSQVWNVYALWGRDWLDRDVLGFEVPVTWLQAFDSLVPIIAVPPVLALWRAQAARGREPTELGKIGLGCAIIGVAFLWLALGSAGRTPLAWVVVFHTVLNIGWLYLVPTTSALFSRVAPAAVTGVVVGSISSGVFIGSTVSGWLGRFYEVLPPQLFWLLHAGVALAGALVMLLGRHRLAAMLGITRSEAVVQPVA